MQKKNSISSWMDSLFGIRPEEEDDDDIVDIETSMEILGLTDQDLSIITEYKAHPLQFCLKYLNTSYSQYVEFQSWRSKTKSQKIEDLIPQANSFMQFCWLAFASLKANKHIDENWRYEEWDIHLERAKTLMNSFSKEEGYSLKKVNTIIRYLFFMCYVETFGVRQARNAAIIEVTTRLAEQVEAEPEVMRLPQTIKTLEDEQI